MITKYFDQFNEINENVSQYTLLGLSRLNLEVDTFSEDQFNEIIDWFKDGGKLTFWYGTGDKYERNKYIELVKGYVKMTVGSEKEHLKKRPKKRTSGWDRIISTIVDDAVSKANVARKAKLDELGRKYTKLDGTLLPYVLSIFGQPANDK